jgi:peptidoglycan hydrolase-like protein with peptidoglycan-binding domain
VRRVAGLVVLVTVAVALGWWAGTTTLTPAATGEDASADPVTAEVVEATVGRSLTVGVTLRQPVEPVATNTLTGMVTDVSPEGERQVGDTVFSVAGTPVRVVAGEEPFYRDLARGARGGDVRQLQEALATLGHLDSAPDGVFGSATVQAVRAWQEHLGVERTGTVRLGEVLAVPALPSMLRVGDQIRRGVLVGGGEAAVLARTGEQDFALVLSSDQAATITSDVPIRVAYEDLVWDATVVEAAVDERGDTVMRLANADGGPVCQDDCGRLPPDEQVSLRAQAVVVPEVTGPAVPVAAVRTSTGGGAYVVTVDGSRRDVEVRGSGQGLAVLQGVEVGDTVAVTSSEPGDPASAGQASTTPEAGD